MAGRCSARRCDIVSKILKFLLSECVCALSRQVEYKEHVMAGRCNTGAKGAAASAGQAPEEETRWGNVLQVPHLSDTKL